MRGDQNLIIQTNDSKYINRYRKIQNNSSDNLDIIKIDLWFPPSRLDFRCIINVIDGLDASGSRPTLSWNKSPVVFE